MIVLGCGVLGNFGEFTARDIHEKRKDCHVVCLRSWPSHQAPNLNPETDISLAFTADGPESKLRALRAAV